MTTEAEVRISAEVAEQHLAAKLKDALIAQQAAEIERLKAEAHEDGLLRVRYADREKRKDALLRQALDGFEKAATLDGYTKYSFEPSSIFRHYYASATGDYVDLHEFRQHMDAPIAAIKQHLEGKQ